LSKIDCGIYFRDTFGIIPEMGIPKIVFLKGVIGKSVRKIDFLKSDLAQILPRSSY